MKKDLLSRLIEYGKSDVYPFHMPGHKRRTDSGFVENFPNPFSVDVYKRQALTIMRQRAERFCHFHLWDF